MAKAASVAAPSLSPNDCIWAIDSKGTISAWYRGLARPQVRAGMQHHKRQPKLGGELNLLDERLDGAIAILGRLRAEVDQVTRVAEDAGEAVRGQFVRIQRAVLRRDRFAEPLHVILNENLDDLAVDAATALEGFPNPATGGHVCAEFHRGL